MNGKKVLIIVLVILVIIIGTVEIGVVLSNRPKSNNEEQKAQGQTPEVAEKFSYTYDGVTMEIGEEFSKEKYGEELEYSEIASCAFEGLDKTYTYEHYEVTTYPDGDKENVLTIYFLDETIATNEGLSIGDDYEKMVEIYGDNFTNHENQYTYQRGNTLLEFIVENGVVTSIDYTLDVGQ